MKGPVAFGASLSPPEVPCIPVRTLLGSAQVPLALRCLASLVQTSAEKIAFIIHEDGSLKEREATLLREKLPVLSIVSRAEADDLVTPRLSVRPACRHYRQSSPLALKLFDVSLLETAETYYCDSDVLFIAPHTGLFHGILKNIQSVFMRDDREAYALRPWSVRPLGAERVLSRLNSGLMALAPGVFDLDFIEAFLKRNRSLPAFQRRPGWTEQTCWAALAARLETRIYDSRQFRLAAPNLAQKRKDLLGIHFVSSYRSMIEGFPEQDLLSQVTTPPSQVRLEKASIAHLHKFILSEATARWNR